MRLAGAPISWGVNELPGWGYRMPAERVLGEMRDLGLDATELGPPGYLPEDPDELRDLLARTGLRLVAGFLAVVMHERNQQARALADVEREATILALSGAEVIVLAAALPGGTYERRERLSREAFKMMAETLAAAEDLAGIHGLRLAFHPHAGTAVQLDEEVNAFLQTTDTGICLDTGHLFLGGCDPARLAREAGARVTHVHLKDVDAQLATRFRVGELSYAQAIRSGLYRPLGEGDLDIPAVIHCLQEADYEGWYVLEQDMALTAEPQPGTGPVAAARQSLDYIRKLSSADPIHHHREGVLK